MPAQGQMRAQAAPAPTGPLTGIDDGIAHYGVLGESNKNNGVGVRAVTTNGLAGVHAIGVSAEGVRGRSDRASGVYGFSLTGEGVRGYSDSGEGVYGESAIREGVLGLSGAVSGVAGASSSGSGVYGQSDSGKGTVGLSNLGIGVYGGSNSREGVYGESNSGSAVRGSSGNGIGVIGISNNNDGVYGISQKSAGVVAQSFGWHALYARAWNEQYKAAFFKGDVVIDGNLDVWGEGLTRIFGPVFAFGHLFKFGGGFKIDHPVDPANKYLSHSFVESPDMKNMYDGLIVLDDEGKALIELPDWFVALNKDFRYQLTAIGSPSPNLYIEEQISKMNSNLTRLGKAKKNKISFKIAGGRPGIKVSWQVTGIRKDPWANTHRIKVEEDKPSKEKGLYLYPALYGKPARKGISQFSHPEVKKQKGVPEGKIPKRVKPIKLKKFVIRSIREEPLDYI